MFLTQLNNDILNYISTITNIHCHICYKKFDINEIFYKKQGKFYYCCKECYEFI